MSFISDIISDFKRSRFLCENNNQKYYKVLLINLWQQSLKSTPERSVRQKKLHACPRGHLGLGCRSILRGPGHAPESSRRLCCRILQNGILLSSLASFLRGFHEEGKTESHRPNGLTQALAPRPCCLPYCKCPNSIFT